MKKYLVKTIATSTFTNQYVDKGEQHTYLEGKGGDIRPIELVDKYFLQDASWSKIRFAKIFINKDIEHHNKFPDGWDYKYEIIEVEV